VREDYKSRYSSIFLTNRSLTFKSSPNYSLTPFTLYQRKISNMILESISKTRSKI